MAPHSDERLKISVAQKKAIRQYYKMQAPGVGHKHIKQWFFEEYGIQLPFSTISNILSSKFDHLDQLGASHNDAKRCRPPRYPDLETALTECIGRMKAAGMDLTGAVLLKTAHNLWPNIPAYEGQPVPSLSGGWVEKFKTRHNIKLRSAKPKGPVKDSNDQEPSPEEIFDSIRSEASNYSREDIFTMSETELYWRLPPNSTALRELSSLPRQESGERVTVALAVNSSGTQKVVPWIVGHYTQPKAFCAPGNDIKSLQIAYSSNNIAWMTGAEWQNWLKWFDGLMDRPVLLIVTPHRAHEIAYTMLTDTYKLQNTKVMFLPSNASPLSQPMEMGLVQNFKALYRQSFLSFINDFYYQRDIERHVPQSISIETQDSYNGNIRYIDQIEDPHAAINLYIAAFWIQRAWFDVTPTQVCSSWAKAALFGVEKDPDPDMQTQSITPEDIAVSPSLAVPDNVLKHIGDLMQSIQSSPSAISFGFMGTGHENILPSHYVSLPEEIPTEHAPDFIELCVSQFQPQLQEPEDTPIYILAPVSSKAAHRAVKLLVSFEEQQPDKNMRYLQLLKDYKDLLFTREATSRQAEPGGLDMGISRPDMGSPVMGKPTKRRANSYDFKPSHSKRLSFTDNYSRQNSASSTHSLIGVPSVESSPISLTKEPSFHAPSSSISQNAMSTLIQPGQQTGNNNRHYGNILMNPNSWRSDNEDNPDSSPLTNPSSSLPTGSGFNSGSGLNSNVFFNNMNAYSSGPPPAHQNKLPSQQFNGIQTLGNFLSPLPGQQSGIGTFNNFNSRNNSGPLPYPSSGLSSTSATNMSYSLSSSATNPLVEQSGSPISNNPSGSSNRGLAGGANQTNTGYPFFGPPVFFPSPAS